MTAYFLSDLHLGAPYFPDSRENERRVVSFLDSIKHDADVIYLVGDILDYWYEYRYVVPRGFVRFFGKLAELSDMGIRIVWYIGNHDIWIFDYLPSELGIEVIDGYSVENLDGVKFFITHGDGIGRLKPIFKILRKLFRNKMCQKMFAAIHPRWTIPFAYGWSNHSRKSGHLPTETDATRMMKNIRDFSISYNAGHPDIRYYIYGHLHLLERFSIGSGDTTAEVVVLGEWLSRYSYARWNGRELEISRWDDSKSLKKDENVLKNTIDES